MSGVTESPEFPPAPPVKRRGRGFAGMSRERQRQLASLGGKAAHAKGTAHEFDTHEAKAAGQKGGSKILRLRGREYFQEIGRRGGRSRTLQRRLPPAPPSNVQVGL